MTLHYSRSELLALSLRPTPRLLPGNYRTLRDLCLLKRMSTSRSRRKKKKRCEKLLSDTEAKLFLVNARDLRNFSSCTKVTRLLAASCPDLLAVTETWFTDAAGDQDARSVFPRGYLTVQKPRNLVLMKNNSGGGSALFHKNSVKVTVLSEFPEFLSFECLDLSVVIKATKVRLIVIYRPPDKSRAQFIEEFSSLLESTVSVSSKLLITGDFNLHVDAPNTDAYANHFLTLIESFGFQQHVNQPTHNGDHILDLVLSRQLESLVKSTHVDESLGRNISDHSAIKCMLNIRPPRWPTKTITFRSFKSIDLDAFLMDIDSLPLVQSPADSLDDRVTQYNEGIRSIIDKHAPLQTKTIVIRPFAPWRSFELRGLKAMERWAERMWQAARRKRDPGSERFHKVYIKHRLKYSTALDTARTDSVRERVSDCGGDMRALFQLIGDLTGSAAPPVLPDRPCMQKVVDDLSEFFSSKISTIRSNLDRAAESTSSHTLQHEQSFLQLHEENDLLKFRSVSTAEVTKLIESSPSKSCSLDPLPTQLLKKCLVVLVGPITDIINLSLSTGAFPSSLKHGIITPLLKKTTLDRNVLSNFRPVSNLSFLSKLIERAVLMLLTEHLSKFSLLPVHQSAYRANHSTETALLSLFDDFLNTADQNDASALVLLDLSAAFDTIDHQILLERLSHCFGLSGTAVNWFSSYLSNRTQSVHVGAYTSAVVHLLFGVAQGSVLGGPLFIMYVTPFAEATATEGVQVSQFSDDKQARSRFALKEDFSSQSQCHTRLGCWFEKTDAWLTINRVQLNIPKSTLIYTYYPGRGSTTRHIDSTPLQIGSSLVQPSTTACNLGVIIDTHLTMEAQVMKTCRATNFHLSRINKIRRFLDFSSVKCVVNALVLSRLDYCNSLYLNLPSSLLNRLQRVQNASVCTIFNLRTRTRV